MKATITIPSSLSEITLDQYQQYDKVVKNQTSPEGKIENLDFVKKKMIQIFCKVPYEIISKIQRKDFVEIITTLNDMLKTHAEFQPTFELDGVQYGFIPDLDEMSLGEFEDMSVYMASWEEMHKAMAVMFRPITVTNKKKNLYRIKEYESGSKHGHLYKNMPMEVVSGAHVFFYNLSNDLLTAFQRSFLKNIQKGKHLGQLNKATFKNGVDIHESSVLLMESISALKTLLKNQYLKYSHF